MISDFPDKNLASIIKNKLIEQLGVKDAPGMMFTPESNLSQEIMNSKEFQKHVKKNLSELIKGNVIENSSTYFKSNINLRLALGHADILYTGLDKNGNLFSFVLDTYDFNKDDPNLAVQVARSVSDSGLAAGYYTINVIFIPNSQFKKLFF